MSTTQPPALSPTRVTLALITLFLSTFALGSAELVVVGVLNLIADDMDVSISATGTLVTAYALGLAIGGPILATLSVRIPRRALLIGTLVLYLLANLTAVLGGGFAAFIVARVITGSLQGLFVGIAFTVAISISPPERIGRAMSAVIGGFAVSTALGVPLGTLIGQSLGWRGSFTVITIFGVLCLALILAFVPGVPNQGAGTAGDQLKYAFAPRVLAVLFLAVLLFAGQYAALTYIAPFLEQVTGISGSLISAFLLAYGAATAIGAFGGGGFAAKGAGRAILVANAVLVLALGFLYFVGSVPILVAVGLIVWGLFGFGMVPSLQFRIVNLAGPGGAVAATLPASAINAGIAIGAVAGGWAVSGNSPSAVFLTGAIILVVALPVAWATSLLKPPVVAEDTTPAPAATETAPEPA